MEGRANAFPSIFFIKARKRRTKKMRGLKRYVATASSSAAVAAAAAAALASAQAAAIVDDGLLHLAATAIFVLFHLVVGSRRTAAISSRSFFLSPRFIGVLPDFSTQFDWTTRLALAGTKVFFRSHHTAVFSLNHEIHQVLNGSSVVLLVS